ncbi:YbaN family protein [Hyphomicrobium sp. CS1GBMeth3]|uniref:YbaN family protein n=1 Tax=Hyphomicrobium sp. CS1GBMeth3 TaxID=1892845 RepID=UPI0009300016|nr:YbaN family protein [Hyphomicrobium sp. CS1GBMeth3]
MGLSKLAYITIGGIATALAIAGAILPGLPTTPFLLVALWAFARSSARLLAWLESLPLLRHALIEAQRFEERRTIRLGVKLTAIATAWGSVLFTALATGNPVLISIVAAAALGGTFAMWWYPTET